MTQVSTRKAREAKQSAAESIGIDAQFIDTLVAQFYAHVRADKMLGPIFAERVSDWPHHLARMRTFWSSILHKSGGFSGNPMIKHIAIPQIERAEFHHWLKLFALTLDEMNPTPAARELVYSRAETIAGSLLVGIRIHRDGVTDPRHMKG